MKRSQSGSEVRHSVRDGEDSGFGTPAGPAAAGGAGLPNEDRVRVSRPGRTVAKVLLPIAVFLPILSGVLWAMNTVTQSYREDQFWYQLWMIFDIGDEYNVAAWYAAILWLVLGFVGIAAALLADAHRPSWWFFGLVSIAASADEAAALHERLLFITDRMAPYVPIDLHYTWVILGTVIAVVVAAVLIRLMLALHRAQAWVIVVSGALFLFGAVVLETVTGYIHRAAGEFNTLYTVVSYIEELFELVGVSLAIAAVASLFVIHRSRHTFTLTFDGYRGRGTERGREERSDAIARGGD